MTPKLWRHLFIGVAMISLSIWLWFADHYTLELGIVIGILTLLWLSDK